MLQNLEVQTVVYVLLKLLKGSPRFMSHQFQVPVAHNMHMLAPILKNYLLIRHVCSGSAAGCLKGEVNRRFPVLWIELSM